MALGPDPAAGRLSVPMTGNPGGAYARASFPMSGDPDPVICAVHPVAGYPRMRGVGSGTFHFHSWRGWRFGYHDGAGSPGRRHRLGRSHDHGWFVVRGASAENDARDYRHNAKYYFFHNFLGRLEQSAMVLLFLAIV